MKRRIMLLPGIILIAAVFLTGCSQKEIPDAASVAEVTETAAETEPETTAAAESTITASTAVQTSKTTAAATTAAETASAPKTYAHRLEMLNTELGSRPVPEKYLQADYSGTVPPRAQKAIDAGRDMLGTCSGFCTDSVRNCLYVRMYFGFGGEGAQYEYSFFRIDPASGEITGRIDTDDLQIGLRDVYAMFAIGGKLMLASYHGFYAFNDAFDEIVVIDPENEPLGGSTVICDGKIYLNTVSGEDDENGIPKTIRSIYDPAAGTLTERGDEPLPEHAQTVMEYLAEQYADETTRLTAEETDAGETKLIFEWN